MTNFDDVTKENIKEHTPNCLHFWSSIQNISNWSDWIWKKLLFNLRNYQQDIDKTYLYAKDPYEAKYPFSIKKKESTGLKRLNDSKTFIKYANDMDDIYKNIEGYNPNKKRKILIVFRYAY